VDVIEGTQDELAEHVRHFNGYAPEPFNTQLPLLDYARAHCPVAHSDAQGASIW
jgi:hypothetical protein